MVNAYYVITSWMQRSKVKATKAQGRFAAWWMCPSQRTRSSSFCSFVSKYFCNDLFTCFQQVLVCFCVVSLFQALLAVTGYGNEILLFHIQLMTEAICMSSKKCTVT